MLCCSGERYRAIMALLFEVIIIYLAQNVCLDDFYVKFETGSSGVKN